MENGIDHAQSLAVVMPSLLSHQKEKKRQKLLRCALRVWNLRGSDEEKLVDEAIARTREFFQSLGVETRLGEYGIPGDAPRVVAEKLATRGARLGEHEDIEKNEVEAILRLGS